MIDGAKALSCATRSQVGCRIEKPRQRAASQGLAEATGLGQGIAIPHGRIKGLKEATGAFLRLATPVQFDAPDGKPVSMLFVLLVPEQANEQHLQLLSELAQMFSERHFREALSSAPDSAAIHDLFANWGPDAPDQ